MSPAFEPAAGLTTSLAAGRSGNAPGSPQVVVVGSANLDLVVPVSHAPRGGETILGGDLVRHAGGKGANQAVAASRAGGATTAFVGAVGHDDAADILLTSMRDADVQTNHVRRVDSASGMAFISVDAAGENAIVVAPGANRAVTISAPEKDLIAGASVVLAQLEIPVKAVIEAARSRRSGATFMLNAAPSCELPQELWQQVDVLIVNEHEAADLASSSLDQRELERTPQELAALLLTRVPAVIITLGSQGCLVAETPSPLEAPANRSATFTHVPAFSVESVDTTGAGDTFCGVLAASVALSPQTSLASAALVASAAGALATTRHGAQTGVPAHHEVIALAATAS